MMQLTKTIYDLQLLVNELTNKNLAGKTDIPIEAIHKLACAQVLMEKAQEIIITNESNKNNTKIQVII